MGELVGVARITFQGDNVAEFKRLSALAMEVARTKDTGTLQYAVYFNEDESECMVIERYRDSEALIEHATNLGDLSRQILATGTASGELLGEPNEQLRALLANGPVRIYTTFLSL